MRKSELTPIQLLKSCALFSALDEEQLAVLSAQLQPVSFRRNDVIFLKADPGDGLYIIRRGRVKISVLNTDGKDLIINIYHNGDVFGEMALFDGLPRSAAATALETVDALFLKRSSFTRLLNDVPGLAVNIVALLSTRLRYSTEQIELIGLFGAYDRVARKLVHLAKAAGGAAPISIDLSQQELAAMLGLTREWINKVLNTFVDRRLIELNRGQIIVLKLEELQQWL